MSAAGEGYLIAQGQFRPDITIIPRSLLTERNNHQASAAPEHIGTPRPGQ
jgi:hypothetical protein